MSEHLGTISNQPSSVLLSNQESFRRQDDYNLPSSYSENSFFLSFIDDCSIFACWNITYHTLSLVKRLLVDFHLCQPFLRIMYRPSIKQSPLIFSKTSISRILLGNFYCYKTISPGLYWGEIGFLQPSLFSFLCCMDSNRLHTNTCFSDPQYSSHNTTDLTYSDQTFNNSVWNKMDWTFDDVSQWSSSSEKPLVSSGSGRGGG